jgi:hypothetical protein
VEGEGEGECFLSSSLGWSAACFCLDSSPGDDDISEGETMEQSIDREGGEAQTSGGVRGAYEKMEQKNPGSATLPLGTVREVREM